jgi:hypothetical protein
MQYIKAKEGDFLCLCGNTASDEGFFPCNSEGEEVEPSLEDWTTDCYVCDRCGRIIRQSDLRVVGVRFNNALTDDEKRTIFQYQEV